MSSATDHSLAAVAVGTGAGPVSRRGRPRRQYKCQHCARTFKRSEHCIRHERTHTHEKPFMCRYCHKSYSRKDQVTRHERTLHADGKVQRQDERLDSDRENVEDQVHVAWVPPARPSAPETPPHDFEEPEANLSFAGQLNGPALRQLQSPGNEPGFSPSPTSTSSSTVATVIGGRRPSLSSTSSGIARSSDMVATATLTARSPAHQRTTSATTANVSTDIQPAREPGAEASGPDILPTALGLDNEIPTAQARNSTVSPHGSHNQHRPQPSNPVDQHSDPFFFQSLRDIDIDLADFPFSPLPGHMMDLGQHLHNPQMPNHLGLQPYDTGGFEAVYNPRLASAQAILEPVTTKSCASGLDALTPPDTCDIPVLFQDERRPRQTLTLDVTTHLSMWSDFMQRVVPPHHEIDLPPAKFCQAFLSSYVANFHGHLPIIHLGTLCLKTTPSPLLLIMCSIGALYRLDRRRSRQLYDLASRSIQAIPRPSQYDDKAIVKGYSLWYVQARILLSFYAIMSGEKDLLVRTMYENGFYSMVYNKARIALGEQDINLSRMTWHEWVEHESWKRVLGGLLVTSTLTMVLFDMNPGFNASQDLEFDTFPDGALWDAQSSDEWRELRTNSLKEQQNVGRRTLKAVLMDVMLQGKYDSAAAPYRVSAFSALVLMHAVVVHMWQRLQVSQALADVGSATSYNQLGRSLLDDTMKSLARCDAFLRAAQSGASGPDPDDAAETSLVFNCQAVLRIAYIRMFKPASPSDRIDLISVDPAEMEASITSFVAAGMERSPQLLDAVAISLEGLRIPVKLGHLLVRKTAAFRWSVEHAVAGWESALLVTKWVHTVEIAILNGAQASPKERELLALINEILHEAEYDPSESISLAAGVATTWGWMLQDVWIWGITPRMGSALGLLAKGYERDRMANHHHSADAGL